jgi:hypothetical protein
MSADLRVTDHGSIFLLRPITKAGAEWIDDNIGDDAQWYGRAVVVEHRYIADIVDGARADGITIN